MLSKLFKRTEKTKELVAYVSGRTIALNEVPDEVFSTGCLGEGMGIEPLTETVVAPADGEICMIADTRHACGIQLNNGIQLLIHIGLDTVSLDGNGFTVHVKEGQKVIKGQKLITFDQDVIKQAGYNDVVILIVVEIQKKLHLEFLKNNEVTAAEDVIANIT